MDEVERMFKEVRELRARRLKASLGYYPRELLAWVEREQRVGRL